MGRRKSRDDWDDEDDGNLPVTYGDDTAPVFSARDIQDIIEAPLDSRAQQKADQARVRKALMYLAKGNVHRAQAWLDRVAQEDPARAIDLWLKMLKFTVPELRAVAVDLHAPTGSQPTKLSIADLEEFLRSQNIIEGEVVEK